MTAIPKPRPKGKAKKKRETRPQRCMRLWLYLVKLRAGYKCQLTGVQCRKPDEHDGPISQSHHIAGRHNAWLKYDPRNGICLETSTHLFNVHSKDLYTNQFWHHKIREWLSDGVWEELEELRERPGKPNLVEVEAELTRQIEYYEKLARRQE